MQVYDHLKILFDYPFISETDLQNFVNRFCLFTFDGKRGILHNKGYESLTQNKGLYIRLETPTDRKKGYLSISFSLHKFYNISTGNGLHNFNTLTFSHANHAYKMLIALFPFDISKAIVKKYEIGLNIITRLNPDEYMKQLGCFLIKGAKLRIIEDVKQREYKQYSTNKDKDKRTAYIFYNKTHETQSKHTNTHVPDNILRLEIDHRRPYQKIMFSELFTPLFQSTCIKELHTCFINNLHYNGIIKPETGTTTKTIEVWQLVHNSSPPEAKKHYKLLFDSNIINKYQLTYMYQLINKIEKGEITPNIQYTNLSNELKQLILLTLKSTKTA